MGNKKVLFINTVAGTGSVGRIITGLCDVLKAHGVDTLIAYGRGGYPREYNTYRITSDLDVYIHGFMSRITDREGLYSSRATKDFIKVIEEYDPDIVHIHNLHGYYLNYKILFNYLAKSRRRIVWTLHDCWSFTGHCSHFEYIGCIKWMRGCYKCEQLKECPKSVLCDASRKNYLLKREVFTKPDYMQIVTPSEWLKGKVEQSFLREYYVDVVPTGIDLERFSPVKSELRQEYGLAGKKIVLGVANPWRDRKGLNEFVRLSSVLSDKYRIVMIGLKPSQIKSLPDNIIKIEKTNSIDQMAAWYSAADVYVNLTMEDTFPTTNIEALACGTPVVTYRSGGSPESVDETCGIVVERNNMSGVVNAVEKLCFSGDLMRKECTAHAQLYDSRRRFNEYYEKVYDL